jgi:hypothetical protein
MEMVLVVEPSGDGDGDDPMDVVGVTVGVMVGVRDLVLVLVIEVETETGQIGPHISHPTVLRVCDQDAADPTVHCYTNLNTTLAISNCTHLISRLTSLWTASLR